MKLASVKEVLDRMSISASMATCNTDTIESALNAATFHIESILKTPLDKTQRIDYFNYLPGKYDTAVPMKLWLSQRYLYSSPVVEVYFTPTAGVPILDVGPLTAELTNTYIINEDLGFIQLFNIAKALFCNSICLS